MILLCQKNDYLISRQLIKGFLGCPILLAHIGHFRYFPPVLPVSQCVTSQDTNIKEPALSVHKTVPFIGVVINFICLKKCFCVEKWSRNISYLDDQNGQHHSPVWSIWKVREFRMIFFLKNGIIKHYQIKCKFDYVWIFRKIKKNF